MSEQIGWRGVLRALKLESPYWATALPQLPRLVHRALAEDRLGPIRDALERLAQENARRNDLVSALIVMTGALVVVVAIGLL